MKIRVAILSLMLLGVLVPASAQIARRDPLTEAESDELREVAQEPLKRLKLLIKFTGERLTKVEALRTDPNVKNRPKEVHDALDDFRNLIDELDDNIDDYSSRKSDMRKALKEVIDAENDYLRRLQAMKDADEKDPKMTQVTQAYRFVMTDALEAVNLSLEDNKKTLEEQNLNPKDLKKPPQ